MRNVRHTSKRLNRILLLSGLLLVFCVCFSSMALAASQVDISQPEPTISVPSQQLNHDAGDRINRIEDYQRREGESLNRIEDNQRETRARVSESLEHNNRARAEINSSLELIGRIEERSQKQ